MSGRSAWTSSGMGKTRTTWPARTGGVPRRSSARSSCSTTMGQGTTARPCTSSGGTAWRCWTTRTGRSTATRPPSRLTPATRRHVAHGHVRGTEQAIGTVEKKFWSGGGVDCPGPRKETTTRRNVTQGRGGGSNFLGGRELQKGTPSAGPCKIALFACCVPAACHTLGCWELGFVLITVTHIFVHHRCFKTFWTGTLWAHWKGGV